MPQATPSPTPKPRSGAHGARRLERVAQLHLLTLTLTLTLTPTPTPTPTITRQHSFTFCVRRDSNDGSGVGLIADGRESCLKGLGFPNNGQHGIWWLRRFCSQVYSAERIGAIGLGLVPNPNLRV